MTLSAKGEKLQREGKYTEAEKVFRRDLEKTPGNPAKLFNLASSLHAQGKRIDAVKMYSDVLLAPGEYPEAKAWAANNIGILMLSLGKEAEAMQSFNIALSFIPNYAAACNNIGNVLLAKGIYGKAAEAYMAAMEADPKLADARQNCGTVQLLTGDFTNGWKNYEYRWQTPNWRTIPVKDPRRWKGEPLKGKRLLLTGEQGIGDAIQFIRYAPLIRGQYNPAQLLYHGHRETHELFAHVRGGFEKLSCIVDPNDISSVDFDYHCPLLSLPAIFKTRLGKIPCLPYLENIEAATLRDTGRLKVGIVWAGSPVHLKDAERSVKPEQFEPVSRVENVDFYSLQFGDKSKDCPEWAENLAPRIKNFTDTAGLVQALDLVISVDTSIVHLAGAIGKPVWMATPYSPDWRWMLETEESPWYPHLRLFRQQERGEWKPVFERIAEELKKHVERHEFSRIYTARNLP